MLFYEDYAGFDGYIFYDDKTTSKDIKFVSLFLWGWYDFLCSIDIETNYSNKLSPLQNDGHLEYLP